MDPIGVETTGIFKLTAEVETLRDELKQQLRAELRAHDEQLEALKQRHASQYLVIDPQFIDEDKRIVAVFTDPIEAHQAVHSVSNELLVVPVCKDSGPFFGCGMEFGDRLWIVSIEIDTGDIVHTTLGQYSALKHAGKLLFTDIQSYYAGNVIDVYVLAKTRAAAHIQAKQLYGSMPSVMQLSSSWEAFEGPVSLAEIEDYFDRVF